MKIRVANSPSIVDDRDVVIIGIETETIFHFEGVSTCGKGKNTKIILISYLFQIRSTKKLLLFDVLPNLYILISTKIHSIVENLIPKFIFHQFIYHYLHRFFFYDNHQNRESENISELHPSRSSNE